MLTAEKYPVLGRQVGSNLKDMINNVKREKTRKGFSNYPVGSFLIKLKNAVLAGIEEISFEKTKLIEDVAELLKREGFISQIDQDDGFLRVRVSMRNKKPVLMDVRLVSRPGLRVYMKYREILQTKGPWILILSTPLGVMTGAEALKKKTGGEVIAKVI